MALGHGRCRPHEGLALTEGVTEERQQKWLTSFRSKIEPNDKTGCWLWVGSKHDGYGMAWAAKGSWYAHRYSYVWFYGGHDQGKQLDHMCNTTDCVRPDHLWPITGTDNKSLQHQRALAGDLDYWQHTVLIRSNPRIDSWAQAEGLPYGKAHRVKLSNLRAQAHLNNN
ncbi:hypothetical protein AOZ07_03365 [Glutamicibacter halophytocola]|nr:hypothetical protein AOZ07_03365 [Glutamicibacter halophytocola]